MKEIIAKKTLFQKTGRCFLAVPLLSRWVKRPRLWLWKPAENVIKWAGEREKNQQKDICVPHIVVMKKDDEKKKGKAAAHTYFHHVVHTALHVRENE